MNRISRLLTIGLFAMLSVASYATEYCNKTVTSLSGGSKTATVTAEDLGGGQYRFTFVSDDEISSMGGRNFYCNPGGVNIGNTLQLQADNKTIVGTFECSGTPSVYASDIFIVYPGTGEAHFNFPGIEFKECAPPSYEPPVWNSDPTFSCGSSDQFALAVSSRETATKVAGYKVTIGGKTIDVPLTTPIQNHTGVIIVSLEGTGITLTAASDYAVTVVPYNIQKIDGEAKTVNHVKLQQESIAITSVTCGTASGDEIKLIPTVSGGTAAAFQVSYGSTTEIIEGSSSVIVTGLTPETTYNFTVKPVDGCGNISSSSATAQCTTTFEPHGGADMETVLTETEFELTTTGNCGTSVSGGTAFSVAGASGAYSHTLDEVDMFGDFTLNASFSEAYSNGYFHESGVSDTENQYAILSNPKVLNGTYIRKSDSKNRLVVAVGNDPAGQVSQLFQYKRTNLAAGTSKVSFTIEDLTTADECPQTNLPGSRQVVVRVYKNGTMVHESFNNINIGTSFDFNWTGSVLDGDDVTVEVSARYLATCTALAFSDFKLFSCLNKSIETTVGSTVFCEDTDVTLVAMGSSSNTFTWYKSTNNVTWTTVPGSGSKIDVQATLGNSYYKYVDGNGAESKVFTLLGQVCCSYIADQKSVWKETFGNGTGRWENANVKNHTFRPYPQKIDDTYYAVVSNSSDANQDLDWPGGKTDHTGDPNGGFLVINVNNTIDPPVLIYSQTITPEGGFCESTYYNLSLFASNIAPGGLPSSFEFEVVDAATLKVLGKGNTGDIHDFAMANWTNYGTSFSPENSTSVIINIYNTGAAGGGNDVVLDDISVSVCNAKIDLFANYPEKDVVVDCGDEVTLTAVVTGNLMTYFGMDNPYVLWTKSTDGGLTWSSVDAASGNGKFTYTTKAENGDDALYRIIVSKTEADARKILNNESYTGCLLYTITNESSVSCTGCGTIEVTIEEDMSACADATTAPTIPATVTTGEVAKYIWKEKKQGDSDFTIVATHITTSKTDSYTPSAVPTVSTTYQVVAVGPDDCEDADTMLYTVYPTPDAPHIRYE